MRQRLPLIIAFGGITALVLHHVVFTLYIDNGVVARDYWRFVHLVDDFYRGELTLEGSLAATNGPFRSLFVPAVILLDGVLFGLPLITIHLAASLLSAVSAAVVLAFVRRHLSLRGPSVLALLCLGLVLLTPMHLYLIVYGQASISIIRVAIYLQVLVWLAHILTAGTSRNILLVWIALFLFAVIFVGTGYMPALVATIGLLSLSSLMSGATLLRARGASATPERWERPLGVLLVAGAAFAAAWLLLYNPEGQPLARVLGQASVLDQPAAVGRFFVGVMATSLLAEHAPRASIPTLVLLGTMATLAAIAAVLKGLVSFRRRGPVAVLAAGMAGYSLLVAASISLARVGFGPGAAFAHRYFADTTLWQAGAFLLIIPALVGRTTGASKERRHSALGRVGAFSVMVLLALIHTGVFHDQWRRAPYVKARAEQIRETVRTSDRYSDDELQRRLAASDRQFEFVEEGIAIMERYRLNVFRESEPPPRSP